MANHPVFVIGGPDTQVAYNSCRSRDCPKCQGAAAKDWLAARQAELLPVAYYHGRLQFFGEHRHLAGAQAFARYMGPLRKVDWVVYATRSNRGGRPIT